MCVSKLMLFSFSYINLKLHDYHEVHIHYEKKDLWTAEDFLATICDDDVCGILFRFQIHT